jgi:hypothetical protein
VCVRVTDGARKINRHGGAIHLYIGGRQSLFPIACPHYPRAQEPQAPMAPIEVRDHVYSSLIRLSPATRYHDALISGAKGLLGRGLSRNRFDRYGGLPASRENRESLASGFCKKSMKGLTLPISCAESQGFGKTLVGFISGKRLTTTGRSCLFQCVTGVSVSKLA